MSSEWDRSETTAVGSVPLALSFGLSSDVAEQSDDECDRGTISVRSFTGDCKEVKSVCVPVVACSERNLQMWPALGRPQRPQRYGLRGLCARFFFSTGAAAAVASKSVNSPLAASLSPIAKACGTCFAVGAAPLRARTCPLAGEAATGSTFSIRAYFLYVSVGVWLPRRCVARTTLIFRLAKKNSYDGK